MFLWFWDHELGVSTSENISTGSDSERNTYTDLKVIIWQIVSCFVFFFWAQALCLCVISVDRVHRPDAGPMPTLQESVSRSIINSSVKPPCSRSVFLCVWLTAQRQQTSDEQVQQLLTSRTHAVLSENQTSNLWCFCFCDCVSNLSCMFPRSLSVWHVSHKHHEVS